jgi:hypothetical protein
MASSFSLILGVSVTSCKKQYSVLPFRNCTFRDVFPVGKGIIFLTTLHFLKILFGLISIKKTR